MKRFDLNGKVVFITGASGGIGQAIARRFRERGAKLVLTDISQKALDAAFASFGAESVLLLPLDVTDMAATKAVVRQAVERFGRLDMAIANAGISARQPSTMRGIDEDEFRQIINVNLLGVWNTVKASLPSIVEAQGHVLITASVYSFVNGMANAPYATSKAAVEAMGRALRAELAGTGATAGVLYPGWVDTSIAQVAFGGHDTATRLIKHLIPGPFGRLVQPDEVAQATVAGVEKRAARIIAPKRWAPVSWLRGIVNVLSDATLDKDVKVHEMVRELEKS